MKKIYSFIAFAIIGLDAQAQNATPNGDFENWNSTTCEEPVGFSNSNPESVFRCNTGCNVVKSTDVYSGNFALELTTYLGGTDTCFGYAVTSPNPSGQNPCNWSGGIPFNQVPTGIRGYYQSTLTNPDSAGILVAFRNNGVCLGLYMYKFGGNQSTYAPFAFTFNPPIAGTPDTLMFAAVSSDVFSGVALNGSMLKLDSVSLIGVTQPAALNGGFENWQSEVLEQPLSWYSFNTWDAEGVAKTTDFKFGQYAVELTTYLGDNNGVPRANAGGISTGYYVSNCQGPNCQKGGYPFTNQIDTLCFYYKYAPVNGDTAYVGLNFKNMGTTFWSTGGYIPSPVGTYIYMEVPFNTVSTVDSVIVSFQSSGWNDTTMASLGSSLKIDDVHFKSQPSGAGIHQYDPSAAKKIYPNPNNGIFTIENIAKHDLVRIMNVYGQEVNAVIAKENNAAIVQVSTPGAYMVYINSRGKISQQKVIVGKE